MRAKLADFGLATVKQEVQVEKLTLHSMFNPHFADRPTAVRSLSTLFDEELREGYSGEEKVNDTGLHGHLHQEPPGPGV